MVTPAPDQPMQMDAVIEDHRLHLLYASTATPWRMSPLWTLRDLGDAGHLWCGADDAKDGLCAPWLPLAWRPALQERYAEPLWSLTTEAECSSDLSPTVLALCGGAASGPVRLYVPSQSVWNNRLSKLLDGRGLWLDGRRAEGRRSLRLVLTSQALKRLAPLGWAGTELVVTLHRPKLLQFSSDVTVLDLPVTVAPVDAANLPAAALAEAVHALARLNTLCWAEHCERRSPTFTLGDIARTLLEGAFGCSTPHRRVYTASHVRISAEDGDDTADRLAIALAKHYTEDYSFAGPSDQDLVKYRPFDGIHRVAAREGCAVVLRGRSGQPEFLKKYHATAFSPAYLPLAILSLHESYAWRTLAQDLPAWSASVQSGGEQIETLRAIRARAIQHRLAFSLPHVSEVADHERWKAALDRALGLPALRTAMVEEISTIEAVLSAEHQARLEAAADAAELRHIWLSAVAAGGVVWATVFGVLKDVLAPTFGATNWWPLPVLQIAPAATTSCLIGALLGVGAGLLVRRRMADRQGRPGPGG